MPPVGCIEYKKKEGRRWGNVVQGQILNLSENINKIKIIHLGGLRPHLWPLTRRQLEKISINSVLHSSVRSQPQQPKAEAEIIHSAWGTLRRPGSGLGWTNTYFKHVLSRVSSRTELLGIQLSRVKSNEPDFSSLESAHTHTHTPTASICVLPPKPGPERCDFRFVAGIVAFP